MNSGIHHTAVLQSSLGSRVVAPCFCCRSPCSMQKSGVRSGPTGAETTDTGTRNKMREETPGPKTSTPVRSPPPAHNNHLFINTWPAMRAHPSWQRPPLGCHIFFSLFCCRRTQTFTCCSLPRLFQAAYLIDLLIIIEIDPIIISAETSSIEVKQDCRPRDPAASSHRRLRSAPNRTTTTTTT
uniref:Uncharacterized protein n=1 Tax=Zea mays TaxID=4577 RepID=C0PKC7_MAIZE|nr:unknown [Zea mays]